MKETERNDDNETKLKYRDRVMNQRKNKFYANESVKKNLEKNL